MGSTLSGDRGEGAQARDHIGQGLEDSQASPESDVDPCMTCLRVELGETVCYTGICEECGETPPSLQWMYPEGPPGGDSRRSGGSRSSWGPGRRRPFWLRSLRSSSSDRPVSIPHASQSAARRRMSMDNTPAWGVSPARIDRASFNHTYRGQGITEKDGTCCVICLSDFIPGNNVRRLACLHLFHTSCVDVWLINNRICPVCRVDVEAAAAQFRADWVG